MSARSCSVPGCERGGRTVRGWCMAHYDRWRRHGSPTGGRSYNGDAQAFVEAAAHTLFGKECSIWPFGRTSHGYGVGLPHREICRLVHGEPPTPEHEAAHSCGNGAGGCVNPNHLSWKTRSGNQMDRVEHGTSNRGERHGMSKLSEDDVVQIRAALQTERVAHVARRFGVSPTTVTYIRDGKRWAWLSERPAREVAHQYQPKTVSQRTQEAAS